MAPAFSSLYTISFFIAAFFTLFAGATLRLLAILPNRFIQCRPFRRMPTATRVLVVLGSGGHTHEMFYLLKDLDTRKYTHRTYVVSSGDSFSAQRAVEFESVLEDRQREAEKALDKVINEETKKTDSKNTRRETDKKEQPACVGPNHYNIATLPRARKIHQPLATTPLTSLHTLLRAFSPLLSAPPLLPNQPPQTHFEAAAQDLPDLIITNGPATAVIVVLAALILRFFNVQGANGREKCKTIYVESFARVKTLSLSGRLLLKIVDRFLVQWEELEGKGGRAEFRGILV